MQTETMTLKPLIEDLLRAKHLEKEATDKRVAIETEIIAIVGKPDEGARTIDTDGYKLTVEQGINRKIDEKAWSLVKDKIPESLWPIRIEEKISVDNAGVRWLRENEPGYFQLLCRAMEEKPAKPSVKVKEVPS